MTGDWREWDWPGRTLKYCHQSTNVVGDLEPQKNDRVEFGLRESVRKPGSMEAVQVKLL
jgi:hypothetical protein